MQTTKRQSWRNITEAERSSLFSNAAWTNGIINKLLACEHGLMEGFKYLQMQFQM